MTAHNDAELDAFIAERVMGWKLEVAKVFEGERIWRMPNGDVCTVDFWSPSSQIDQAIEALEHWRSQDDARWWEISSPYLGGLDFAVALQSSAKVIAGAYDSSIQLAICLAIKAAENHK